MTQPEIASVLSGDTNNYSPLALNALTNNTMGYLPEAQYMTPAQYGAFRTLPSVAYQQPVNQNPGYINSWLMQREFFAPDFYNPAVNPALAKIEASRYTGDVNSLMLGNAIGTAADLATMVASKNPYIAAGLLAGQTAISALPFQYQGPTKQIQNARALQRLTRSKITSGIDMDSAWGSGFSISSARNLDRALFRESLSDSMFNADDYRKMLGLGMQNGVFDYANNVDQYKRILKNIRNNMTTLMEVTGSQDFQDAMKELKRLQDMGASQQNWKSILRRENMYARITGLKHSDLVNTYGQMGALEFSQRGLSNIQGSQMAMHNAAVVTMGQRNGTMSAAYVAANGGVSGLAQSMTEAAGQSMQAYKEQLLLAAYDPTTGKMREGFSLSDYEGEGGLQKLQADAAKTSDIIARQGPLAKQKFHAKQFDVMQELDEREGGAAELHYNMSKIIGRASGAGEGLTDDEYARLGMEATGTSADKAYHTVSARKAIQAQAEREKALARVKQLEEDKKANQFWNRVGRWFDRNISGAIDTVSGFFTDTFALGNEERKNYDASGLAQVEGISSPMMAALRNGRVKKSNTTVLNEKAAAASRAQFGNYIGQRTANAQRQGIGYDANSTASGKGAINDFGWTKETLQGTMAHYNQMKSGYFSQDFMKMVNNSNTREELMNNIGKAAGGLVDFSKGLDESKLREGMILGTNTGDSSKGGATYNKTAQVFKNAKGEWMVSVSDANGGVQSMKASDWYAQQEQAAKDKGVSLTMSGADAMAANRNMGGGKSDSREMTFEERANSAENSRFTHFTGGDGARDASDLLNEGNVTDWRMQLYSSTKEDERVEEMNHVADLSRMATSMGASYESNADILQKSLGEGVKFDREQMQKVLGKVSTNTEDIESYGNDVIEKMGNVLATQNGWTDAERYKWIAEKQKDKEFRSQAVGMALSANGQGKGFGKESVVGQAIARQQNIAQGALNKKVTDASKDAEKKLNEFTNDVFEKDDAKKVQASRNEFLTNGGSLSQAASVEGLAVIKNLADKAAEESNPHHRDSKRKDVQEKLAMFNKQYGTNYTLEDLNDSKKMREAATKLGGEGAASYYDTMQKASMKGGASAALGEQFKTGGAFSQDMADALTWSNASLQMAKMGTRVEDVAGNDKVVRLDLDKINTSGNKDKQAIVEQLKKVGKFDKATGKWDVAKADFANIANFTVDQNGKIKKDTTREDMLKARAIENFSKDQTNNIRRTADATEETATALKILIEKETGKKWEDAAKVWSDKNAAQQEARMVIQQNGG